MTQWTTKEEMIKHAISTDAGWNALALAVVSDEDSSMAKYNNCIQLFKNVAQGKDLDILLTEFEKRLAIQRTIKGTVHQTTLNIEIK